MNRLRRLLLKVFIMSPCVILLSSCCGDCFYDDLVGRTYVWQVTNHSGMWITGMDGGDFANNFGTYGLTDGTTATILTCNGPKENASFDQLFAAAMYEPIWVEIYLYDEARTTIRLRSDSDDEFSRLFFDECNWVRHEYEKGFFASTRWVFTILPEHLSLPGVIGDDIESSSN